MPAGYPVARAEILYRCSAEIFDLDFPWIGLTGFKSLWLISQWSQWEPSYFTVLQSRGPEDSSTEILCKHSRLQGFKMVTSSQANWNERQLKTLVHSGAVGAYVHKYLTLCLYPIPLAREEHCWQRALGWGANGWERGERRKGCWKKSWKCLELLKGQWKESHAHYNVVLRHGFLVSYSFLSWRVRW